MQLVETVDKNVKKETIQLFGATWVRFSKRSNSKQTILVLHNHSTTRKPNPHITTIILFILVKTIVESNYDEAYKQLAFVTAAKNKMLLTGPPKKKIFGIVFSFLFGISSNVFASLLF